MQNKTTLWIALGLALLLLTGCQPDNNLLTEDIVRSMLTYDDFPPDWRAEYWHFEGEEYPYALIRTETAYYSLCYRESSYNSFCLYVTTYENMSDTTDAYEVFSNQQNTTYPIPSELVLDIQATHNRVICAGYDCEFLLQYDTCLLEIRTMNSFAIRTMDYNRLSSVINSLDRNIQALDICQSNA